MISSCSLIKALVPSPYSRGMLTSNIPIKQYAISSTRDASHVDAHRIRCAIFTLSTEVFPSKTFLSIPKHLAIALEKFLSCNLVSSKW
jgi:hypothetical protein